MRIGLLAMSGLRAHDPELLKLGLTLPGFVERSRQVARLPSLGLLALAACTPPGHELRYAEADEDLGEPDWLYDCDLVAIGTFSAQVFEAYAIADRLRAAGVLVAIGGLHASALPREAAEHADFVAVGEGERTWPAIVRAAEDRSRRGVFDADEEPPFDVATLRIPRYDLLADGEYNRVTVQTSRGCPWRCDFCASTVMLAQRYRKRPVEHVVRDVIALRRFRPGAFVELADDNTFVDKAWGRELCDALAPLGIKWFTETDLSVADDPELLERMARAGCRQLLIGVESPDEHALAGIELRTDFKARRARDAAAAVERIQAHGITVDACFVLGLDSHGPEAFGRVLDFVDEVRPYEVQITCLTAFPGTPLHERLAAERRILEPGRWDLCTLFDVNFEPARMSPDELRRGFRELARRLYSSDAVARRRQPFYARLHERVRARRALRSALARP